MISFSLLCENSHKFEGWFRSAQAYDDQAAEGALTCPLCNSHKISKAIMAPAIARSGRKSETEPKPVEEKPEKTSEKTGVAVANPAPPMDPRAAQFLKMARKVQEHVEKNFENVGDRFASEARAIHSGEAEARDIYGQATIDDAKGLNEDGINVMALPTVPKLNS